MVFLWRPHLLHDTSWESQASPTVRLSARSAAARSTTFVLVENMPLIKKLENAGKRNFEESDITKAAMNELHPRRHLSPPP